MKSFKILFQLSGVACLALAVSAGAQAFTKADSGWVRIFNGTNYAGLYSRLYAQPVELPTADNSAWTATAAMSIIYGGTDSAGLKTTTGNRGEVGTVKTNYSHYRTRLEYKFDTAVATLNGGLLYGVDESKNRMQNNWPRGIEFQMQQNQTGAAYSIQQVTFNTRVTGSAYSPTGNLVTVCEIGKTGQPCNARSYAATPTLQSIANGRTRWMHIELIQRGADTAWHWVNDTLVMKIWNIRIFNDSTRPTGSTSSGQNSASNFTPDGPYPSGALAIEAEGGAIYHRRWEVMEFPASTPMNENFLHRVVLTNRQPIRPAASSSVSILWRSIGTIPKVKLQYKMGSSGAWQTITDSTANTGTYTWTAPATITDSLRFRISGNDYVVADSTGPFTTTGIHSVSAQAQRFTLDGRGLILSDVKGYDRAEIVDVFGRTIRIIPINGENLHWDLTDGRGTHASKGLYFVRLKGNGFATTVRVPIF